VPSFFQLSKRHSGDVGLIATSEGLSINRVEMTMAAGIIGTSPGVSVPCRICGETIVKGERCLAFMARLPRWWKPTAQRSPRNSNAIRWYGHTTCMVDVLTQVAESSAERPCFRCGKDDIDGAVTVRIKSRTLRYCAACAESFGVKCGMCQFYVRPQDASSVLTAYYDSTFGLGKSTDDDDEEEVLREGAVCCDKCAESYDIDTVHHRRRKVKAERRANALAQSAARQTAGWVDDDL